MTLERSQKYAALKVFKGLARSIEYDLYDRLNAGHAEHLGKQRVRIPSNYFIIGYDGGQHLCYVYQPMRNTWFDLTMKWGLFDLRCLKLWLNNVLCGLVYLHEECKIIHTSVLFRSEFRRSRTLTIYVDIKTSNIFLPLESIDEPEDHVAEVLSHPIPRKIVDGHAFYRSQKFNKPLTKLSAPLLGDFDVAARGDEENHHDVQPTLFKSPEILLGARWSYPNRSE